MAFRKTTPERGRQKIASYRWGRTPDTVWCAPVPVLIPTKIVPKPQHLTKSPSIIVQRVPFGTRDCVNKLPLLIALVDQMCLPAWCVCMAIH